jgi:hypothetical protein
MDNYTTIYPRRKYFYSHRYERLKFNKGKLSLCLIMYEVRETYGEVYVQLHTRWK